MPLSVLLVDDSKTVRSVIAKALRLAQLPVHEVYEASNGQEALDVLEEHWIDIVFADINMPVMNGIEMVDRMNADGLMKTVPVVVVSTEGSQTRIEELRRKGVRDYVRKPFAPEEIREVVDKILGAPNHDRTE
ncbi:response regulator [Candidatus Sumerlaeota bacterium]|nr:response regulator [Candidatus Sumerlaeota bacterium]